MIAILHSGTQIRIEKALVQTIFQRILTQEGAKTWQLTLAEGSSRLYGVNLNQIAAFVEEEDIIQPQNP